MVAMPRPNAEPDASFAELVPRATGRLVPRPARPWRRPAEVATDGKAAIEAAITESEEAPQGR